MLAICLGGTRTRRSPAASRSRSSRRLMLRQSSIAQTRSWPWPAAQRSSDRWSLLVDPQVLLASWRPLASTACDLRLTHCQAAGEYSLTMPPRIRRRRTGRSLATTTSLSWFSGCWSRLDCSGLVECSHGCEGQLRRAGPSRRWHLLADPAEIGRNQRMKMRSWVPSLCVTVRAPSPLLSRSSTKA